MTPETAMRQACYTAEEYANYAINYVNEHHIASKMTQEAKATIIAAMIKAAAMDYDTSISNNLVE